MTDDDKPKQKNQRRSSRPIFIAGGGTGGHIYPAVAVARALQQIHSGLPIYFIGSKKGLETKIVPREGFTLITLPAGQLNKSAGRLTQLLTLLILPLALLKSLWLCLRHRPQAVFGVGGYASGPMMLVASLLGFRTAIWEPNAMPGLANRWLSRFAGQCFLVFDSAKKHLRSKKILPSGVPVRFQLSSQQGVSESSSEKRVLTFGGSQGAHGINVVLRELLLQGSTPELSQVKWVHQIGRRDHAEFSASYQESLPQELKQQVEWTEFLHDMKERYTWADVVICRSGASTVAELAACGKVAILIPFPYAADNHQQRNAEQLVRAGAAEMILQSELTPELLWKKVKELLENPELRARMSESVRQFHRPGSAEEIAQSLLRIDAIL